LFVLSEVPPLLLLLLLLYHWQEMEPGSAAVTLIGVKLPFTHCDCAAADRLVMTVPVVKAPETALVAVPQLPVTTQ
jgi:hypothetical protein